ncbi:SDR family NAD(P)-dependent oxidoreductase [Mycolicibacterium sp. CH28]|nr:SDR family NAD(P)-dependent oxidoreductase [Mycolicibacterium sp. CH28]
MITGASAGIGRASARMFSARGDRVGFLARDRSGLDGAVKDVENAGAQAQPIPPPPAHERRRDALATTPFAVLPGERWLAARTRRARNAGHPASWPPAANREVSAG